MWMVASVALMSGPVSGAEPVHGRGHHAATATVELLPSSVSRVGALQVRRALPRRAHRTVGAWCFADHLGPAEVTEARGVDIGPHPHIGLQTVTWLLAGEILHRDSLGSEQVIRAGQLNLMTAGRGVAHSEEATGLYRGSLHGIQLWVAQPEATRNGPPAFEHHADLPAVELPGALATVIVGTLAGVPSPARRDTDHVGAELSVRSGRASVPLDPAHEHAVIVLEGAVRIGPTTVEPGHLGYLAPGREELALDVREPARLVLLGGPPFGEELLMWWNFVARDRAEVDEARGAWEADDGRFGTVDSPLARIAAPVPIWA